MSTDGSGGVTERPAGRRQLLQLAAAAGLALPALAACGKAAPANVSKSSSTAKTASTPKVKLLPTTGTPVWPVDPSTAQPTAGWSMYATKGSLVELVTFGADIWGTNDNFSYWAEQAKGDGIWSCRAAKLSKTSTGGWSKMGLMLRQDLHSSAVFVDLVATGTNGVDLQYRGKAGADAGGGPGIDSAGAPPVYLKMEKKGATLTVSDSSDGKTWKNQQVFKFTTAKPDGNGNLPKGTVPQFTDPYYVGLCACSHHPTLQGVAGFDHITGLAKPKYYAVYNHSAKWQW